jgi:hypothetical protein
MGEFGCSSFAGAMGVSAHAQENRGKEKELSPSLQGARQRGKSGRWEVEAPWLVACSLRVVVDSRGRKKGCGGWEKLRGGSAKMPPLARRGLLFIEENLGLGFQMGQMG